MIVVDVGCARYGEDESIGQLIERFRPDALYGFDPKPELVNVADSRTPIHLKREAAWIFDGEIGFVPDGLRSHVVTFGAEQTVPCFDLARFIRELYPAPIVLKLDCEGAERALVPHLHATEADALVSLLLVEWHCEHCGTGGNNVSGCPRCGSPVEKIGGLRCPVEEWS